MRLVRVRLRNFRCYKDEFAVDFGNLTVIVGRNEAGKSAVLDALSVFFEESDLEPDDVCVAGNKKNVCIICEFEDLPSSLVIDADHPTDLSSEYLLNERKRLEIHKVYDGSLKKPKLSGTYAYANHPSADGMSDLMGLKNPDLVRRAKEIGVDVTKVDCRVNSELRKSIWRLNPRLPLAPQLISLDEESGRKAWEQMKKHIPVFSLFKSDRTSTDQDDEAQDPMKAAIKEAIRTKETELKEISGHVEKVVREMAGRTVEKIREMDPRLASQLNPRFTPPEWEKVFKVTLTGDEGIAVNKRGSGVRRLILLNFFRAKAEHLASEKGASDVIYAVEEPETCQHPNNQKMLMDAFASLAAEPGCQVIVTTHTPTMARIVPLECLRYFAFEENGTRCVYSGNEDTYRRVTAALGVLPDHGVKLFVCVEGQNDISFLRGISHMLSDAGERVPHLEKMEDEGEVIFVPAGGKNLALWVSRLQHLNVPEYHLYDLDVATPDESPNKKAVDDVNKRAGCKARLTGKREMENYLHPDAIKAARPEVAITVGDQDDVPALAAAAVLKASGSSNDWASLKAEDRKKKETRAKAWLNTQAVSKMTPDLLTAQDAGDEVRTWLREMAEMIK